LARLLPIVYQRDMVVTLLVLAVQLVKVTLHQGRLNKEGLALVVMLPVQPRPSQQDYQLGSCVHRQHH